MIFLRTDYLIKEQYESVIICMRNNHVSYEVRRPLSIEVFNSLALSNGYRRRRNSVCAQDVLDYALYFSLIKRVLHIFLQNLIISMSHNINQRVYK